MVDFTDQISFYKEIDVSNFVLNLELKEKLHSAAVKYFAENAIHKVLPGQPKLLGKAPGSRYSWQIYARKALFNPEFSEIMSILALDLIAREVGHFNFQMAGLETAAVPVMCSIQAHARVRGVNINVVSVRKNRKDYGLYNWIEGSLNNKPVLLVDDICNSTESLRTAMNVLAKEYNTNFISGTFTIVNKCMRDDPNTNYNKNMPENFKPLYLFDLTDFDLIY